MFGFIVLSVASLANLLVGLFVLLNNPKKTLNRQFFILTLTLIGWTTANQLSLFFEDSQQVFVAVNWILFFVVIQNTMFFEFTRTFIGSGRGVFSSAANVTFLIASSVTAALAAQHHFFDSFTINAKNTISPVPSPFLAVFMAHAIFSITASLWGISRSYKHSLRITKRQAAMLLVSSLVLFVVVPITNFIVPIFFNNQLFFSLSPVYALAFALIIAYSIFRHKLFDIRSLVARSVAYAGLLASVAAVYAVVSTVATSFLNYLGLPNTLGVATNVSLVFLLALSFQPLKAYFDRTTNRMFFRDAYVTQEVLDRLSSLLATEIDLKLITNESSKIIANNLRPLHLRFVVFKDGETYLDDTIGHPPKHKLERKMLNAFDKVLVQKDNTQDKKLRETLSAFDTEVLLKLRTNEETVGAILLGPKQSGTVYSKQDIDFLTISEKELAIAVQNSRYFEQIHEFNLTLQREVQDATSELRATNAKLKALDEAKDEFISMASHQLRTPLTSVKGYISMIMEGDAGKIAPSQKKLLEEAFASSQRMVYLIADLLNVSRLKTGKFVVEPAEIDMPRIVEEEISQLQPTAKSRRLKLTFDRPKRFPKVWLDETKIRQVMMNFVDNAIYYTPAGGQIRVTLLAKKDSIEYRVKDNGIGVPKAEQAKLFTKFYRAGNAKKARPDGTGLGLYMAGRVVASQGGAIIFESAEDKGSTFGFRFPLKSIMTKEALERQVKAAGNLAESDE
ncbi:MAG TPA: ATP-binding protein [Candidatus Saccharimonadales bacterium]